MFSFDLFNFVLNVVIKPNITLWILLCIYRYSAARSPSNCHTALLSLGALTIIFIPSSFFLPSLHLDVGSFFGVALYFLHEELVMWEYWYSSLYFVSAVYFFGVFYLLGGLTYDLFQSSKFVDRANVLERLPILDNEVPFINTHEKNRKNKVEFRESAEILSPVVWGVRKPVIILPLGWESWERARLTRVLTHEYCHVMRRDCLVRLTLSVLRTVLWPMPVIRVLDQRLCEYAEYACDDAVVQSGASRPEYAEDLIALSSDIRLRAGMVAIASTALAERVNLVLEGGRDRRDAGSHWHLGYLIIFLMCSIPFFSASLAFDKQAVSQDGREYTIDLQSRRITERPDVPDVLLTTLAKEEFLQAAPPTGKVRNDELSINASVLELAALPEPGEVYNEVVNPAHENFSSPQLTSPPVISVLRRYIVKPEYPPIALRRGIEARVNVRFDISESGNVEHIHFQPSDQNQKYFESSIRRALRKSEFDLGVAQSLSKQDRKIEEVFVFKIKPQ